MFYISPFRSNIESQAILMGIVSDYQNAQAIKREGSYFQYTKEQVQAVIDQCDFLLTGTHDYPGAALA